MALLVWMPLNGNLDNLGTAQVTKTSGTPLYTQGKIGNGLNLNSKVIFNCPTLSGCKVFSVAFWAKIEDDSNITTNWQDIISFNDQKSDNSGTGVFRAESYYNPVSDAYCGIHWHDNQTCAICDINRNLYYYYGTANRGVWHHCVMMCNSDLYIKVYCDGIFVQEQTVNMNGGHLTGVFHIGDTNVIAGCINDVRIYNRILSDSEIKRLARGLVVHYPLSRQGFGQDNLILTSQHVISGSNASGITRTYESDGTMKIVAASGNGNYASLGFQSNSNTNVGNNLSVGDTYTISVDVKVASGTNLPTLFINSGNSYKQLQGNIVLNQWIRAYYTSVWAEPGSTYGNISLHLGFSSAIGTYYFRNFKLEKGSTATPWTPAPSDDLYSQIGLDSNIEYDVSGFKNNAVTINPSLIEYSANTKMNKTSTVFKRSASSNNLANVGYIKAENYYIPDEFTISYWWYYDSDLKLIGNPPSSFCYGTLTSSGYLNDGIHDYDGHITTNFASFGSDTKAFNNSIYIAYPNKTWTHLCITFDGFTMKFYKDGVLYSNASTGQSSKMHVVRSSGVLAIGVDYAGGVVRGASGNISDFRIYATALTADDVLELYHQGRNTS